MAITQAWCTSFIQEILAEGHDVASDTLKMALYDDSATLNRDTTAYSTTNEISGTGYSAGGATLTTVALVTVSGVVMIDFDDVAWSTATFSAAAALIYNSTNSNKAIAVIDFGGLIQVNNGTFTVSPNEPVPATALLGFPT